MTITEVCARTGLKPHSITNWENWGLLPQPRTIARRAANGLPPCRVRDYDPITVLRLQAVAELYQSGMRAQEAFRRADDLVVEWWRQVRK